MVSGEAQKALVKAIWRCIVDASSMNVVMHGSEVNAAIRDFRVAIEAEAVAAERARIAKAVNGAEDHCSGSFATGHDERCPIPAVLAIVDFQ